MTPRRILLTGSAGTIGRCIAQHLVDRGHEVRGLDRVPTEALADAVVADLTDAEAIDRAMADRDTLIHLAAYPNAAPLLDYLLKPNVIGLQHVMDAARRHGIDRVVLASSVQVVSGVKHRGLRTASDAAPTNDYALTKLWAEQMGKMYARLHEMGVLAVRIGWYVRNTKELEHITRLNLGSHYLSPDDTRRFFAAAVETDLPTALPDRFAIVYAISRPPGKPFCDLETVRRLIGYEPRDTFPTGLERLMPGDHATLD